MTVTNHGTTTRDIELTSYGEIVLSPPDADRAHPAFGNLFVETQYHDWCTAITATRRPRSAHERRTWCVHVVDAGPEQVGPVTCETDRWRFVGRGRTTRDPMALDAGGTLSGTTGAVLDPIFALRIRVRLEPRPFRVGRVHDPRGRLARARVRAGRPLPPPARRPARARLRLDLGPGRAARAGHHPRRRRRVPGAGGPPVLRQPVAPGAAGGAAPKPRLAAACSGPSASRATGPSCSRRSTRRTGCPRCASCSPRTTTGGAAG